MAKTITAVVAVLCVVVLLLPIGVLIVSPLGIFATVDENDNIGAMAIKDAIAAVQEYFREKIEAVIGGFSFDELETEMDDMDNWRVMLSVYAVYQTMNAQNPASVILLDSVQLGVLQTIYESTHIIHSSTSVVSGMTRLLKITVETLPWAEIARLFGFSDDQIEILDLLINDKDLDDMWDTALEGVPLFDKWISNVFGDNIAAVAISQVGNSGGERYWQWYGFDSWVDWCACFVSWCADQCGYIDSGICPKFASCNLQGIPWFQARGLWQSGSYTPSPGDYMFVDWGADGEADHVELVVKVDENRVHTVGGNRNGGRGMCSTSTFTIGSNYIYGYGTPKYPVEDEGEITDA